MIDKNDIDILIEGSGYGYFLYKLFINSTYIIFIQNRMLLLAITIDDCVQIHYLNNLSELSLIIRHPESNVRLERFVQYHRVVRYFHISHLFSGCWKEALNKAIMLFCVTAFANHDHKISFVFPNKLALNVDLCNVLTFWSSDGIKFVPSPKGRTVRIIFRKLHSIFNLFLSFALIKHFLKPVSTSIHFHCKHNSICHHFHWSFEHRKQNYTLKYLFVTRMSIFFLDQVKSTI